jgi:hypothetical protein
MKQMMIDMMAMMMPFMKFPVWIGAGLLAIGIILMLVKIVLIMMDLKQGNAPGIGIVSTLLIALGVFYIGCQLLGIYLGMTPMINFGDPTKFEFNTVAFWKIGAVFLVPGIIFRFFRNSKA